MSSRFQSLWNGSHKKVDLSFQDVPGMMMSRAFFTRWFACAGASAPCSGWLPFAGASTPCTRWLPCAGASTLHALTFLCRRIHIMYRLAFLCRCIHALLGLAPFCMRIHLVRAGFLLQTHLPCTGWLPFIAASTIHFLMQTSQISQPAHMQLECHLLSFSRGASYVFPHYQYLNEHLAVQRSKASQRAASALGDFRAALLFFGDGCVSLEIRESHARHCRFVLRDCCLFFLACRFCACITLLMPVEQLPGFVCLSLVYLFLACPSFFPLSNRPLPTPCSAPLPSPAISAMADSLFLSS